MQESNSTDVMKIAHIKWIDSCAPDGWNYKEDLTNEPVEIESIGFVLFGDDKAITISAHVGTNEQHHSPMTIPKVAIIEMKEL